MIQKTDYGFTDYGFTDCGFTDCGFTDCGFLTTIKYFKESNTDLTNYSLTNYSSISIHLSIKPRYAPDFLIFCCECGKLRGKPV